MNTIKVIKALKAPKVLEATKAIKITKAKKVIEVIKAIEVIKSIEVSKAKVPKASEATKAIEVTKANEVISAIEFLEKNYFVWPKIIIVRKPANLHIYRNNPLAKSPYRCVRVLLKLRVLELLIPSATSVLRYQSFTEIISRIKSSYRSNCAAEPTTFGIPDPLSHRCP